MSLSRKCPNCELLVTYKSIYTCKAAEKVKSWCRKCRKIKTKYTISLWSEERKLAHKTAKSLYFKDKFKGNKNPFYGKKHTIETREKLSKCNKSYTKTPEFSKKIKQSMQGIDTSIDLVKLWTEKYGAEEAKIRENNRRQKISKAMSGSGNPMFGKPPSQSSGVGIKGWYKEKFFRSLRELSMMIEFDNQHYTWETGESKKFAISYINPYTNVVATYYPDFIVNNIKMIECKPVSFHNTGVVQAKMIAAKEYCVKHNMQYELIDPIKISFDELTLLVTKQLVVLTEKTERDLNANNIDVKRSSR